MAFDSFVCSSVRALRLLPPLLLIPEAAADVCATVLEAAAAVVPPAPLLDRHKARGRSQLEAQLRQADVEELSVTCPVSVGTALNNLAVLAMVDDAPKDGWEHTLLQAGALLEAARKADKGSIIILRNLAWLIHQTTVPQPKVDKAYTEVLEFAALQHAAKLHASSVQVSYEELWIHVLNHLKVQDFEKTTVRGARSHFSRVIARETWDFSFTHSGEGGIVISGLSGPVDLLTPRDKQISVFELHASLCTEPLGLPKNRYLDLLAEVLLGVHDSFRERNLSHGRIDRDFSADRLSKQWAMQLSLFSVTGLRRPSWWEEEPAFTVLNRGGLNFLRYAVESIVSRRVVGDVLEAGTWRGGSAMWMKAVVREQEERSAEGNPRTVWVADSFLGVPPPRNATAFPDDVWHQNAHHRYAVPLERVQKGFRILDLWNGEQDTSVRFLPGLFHESLKSPPLPANIALAHIDADSFESVSDAFVAIYPLLSPGAVVVVDDWHLNGARRAVLEHRLAHKWEMPLLPVPLDYVYACRQGEGLGDLAPHTMPSQRVQAVFSVVAMKKRAMEEAAAIKRKAEEEAATIKKKAAEDSIPSRRKKAKRKAEDAAPAKRQTEEEAAAAKKAEEEAAAAKKKYEEELKAMGEAWANSSLRTCVITAVCGRYRAELSSIDHLNVSGYVFGGGRTKIRGRKWQRMDHVKSFDHPDPFMQCKFYKTQWHRIPELDKCGVVVWIDSTIELKNTIPLPKEDSLIAYNHQVRSDTHSEIGASGDIRYRPYQKKLQLEKATYKAVPWLAITCWIVMRRGPRVEAMNDEWYKEIREFSPQDQVSFPRACNDTGVPVKLLNDGVTHFYSAFYRKKQHLQKTYEQRSFSHSKDYRGENDPRLSFSKSQLDNERAATKKNAAAASAAEEATATKKQA